VADYYERARQYPQELDALKKVLAAKPDHGYAYVKMGNAYNQLGRHQEALAAFLEGRKLLPRNPALLNNLGWTYGKLGKGAEQLAALREAIDLRPRYATARFNLGIALLAKGDRAGAAAQHAALLEFDEGTAADLMKEMEAKAK
jgi:tetratricopeptide (TPR) repeat protein